jgi:hypothetical protein
MLKATAATEQFSTMAGTKSGPPTTFSESSRMTPRQLCIKYEEIAGVAEAFSKTIAARADWSNPPKTKDELRLQTKPYTDLYNATYALHRTMDTVPWDRGTIQAGEERWYHKQLHEASELEKRYNPTNATEVVLTRIEKSKALTGPTQSLLFQSLKRGENPEKKEYCDTVAGRLWGISQDSESGYY